MRRERHARLVGIHSSPKHVGAGLKAVGLWAHCLSISAAAQQDGWVMGQALRTVNPSTVRNLDPEGVIADCLKWGLLEDMPAGTTKTVIVDQDEQESGVRGGRSLEVTVGPYPVDGYYVHDFLDVNLSKAELVDLREKRRRAGSKGGKCSSKTQASAKQVLKQNASNAQATETETETEDGSNEPSEPDGFNEWLTFHEQVTGRKPPKPGTKALRDVKAMYAARLQEHYTPEDIRFATVGAFNDPFRRENGHYGHVSVLRPGKIHDLAEKGREERKRQKPSGGHVPDATSCVGCHERPPVLGGVRCVECRDALERRLTGAA